MQTRKLGPFNVGVIGLGCMNLSHAYGPPVSVDQADRVIAAAIEAGVDHFDTATLYGFGANEELVGRLLKPHRRKITLASKCGMEGRPDAQGVIRKAIDARPSTLARQCEQSLRRLQTDAIDLYYLHRYDRSVPIEDSVGALGDLVRKGVVRSIGLSEVSAPILLRAHREFPISAVQTEYSLWTRNAEIAVLAAAREIGASFVAFSPLARAFLTGALTDVTTLHATDIRRAMPRFASDAYAENLKLLGPFKALARQAGCTPAQLALAWLLAQDDHILPIVGTTSVAHLRENLVAADLALPPDLLAAADALINEKTVTGARYNTQGETEVNTETFAPA
ncbi:aldo/keto reductase [Rhodoblastus sphagnicola]|uniref:Aldo/keto reductase n=1 Tax=Rhodoblastus sphagnicola TaxID=333368 RepID=A0A2S6NE96_9HYPH|nr:aldo/keto reductase [Rhodoblastus sphagnicola]MBB4199863.1 aryl-alcohol dehydrogenase-like predicted oxidoreductase [Rhodoblastus sphagnicola]PPQ32920.1 aldo/keto reductase [Rhodoblastus sphagnicola]